LTPGLAAALFLAAAALAADAASQPRIAPPQGVECPRDRLTAYVGTVTRLARERDRTTLDIRTDWDTSERVIIAHPAEGPERWFLLRAKPFGAEGWKAIESAPGQLRPGIRASAWVCEGGTNPIVDWNPAAEPPPGP
jgi:hypothetical protein